MTRLTAVMVTGKDGGRVTLARAAVRSFLLSEGLTEDDELVVVNEGPPVIEGAMGTEQGGPRVREVFVAAGRSLGALRNIGLRESQGAYVAQLDDDDWSHPSRLARQVALLEQDASAEACLLRSQVRCDLSKKAATGPLLAFALHWSHPRIRGIPGTIVHRNLPGLRYRALPRSEDSFFVEDFFLAIRVLENSDEPHLYLRFYHGRNTWSANHILRPTDSRTSGLSDVSRAYLLSVVREHYL